MKLLKSPKRILINFNCYTIFNEGQKTLVNDFFKKITERINNVSMWLILIL